MFKCLLKKYYPYSPTCNCGWTMKPFEKWTNGYQWKCVWKKCNWEAFDNGDGRLHWWQRWKKS